MDALPLILSPIANSFDHDSVDADLKNIFLDLFNEYLSARAFDANVLGSPHLGTFELVRRFVNFDGLVLLQGDREEAATRYLYRAWHSGQYRGLHFLRTYMRLLFPFNIKINQLWQDKRYPYPNALHSASGRYRWWLHRMGEEGLRLDGSWKLGVPISGDIGVRPELDTSGMFLTSRVEIALDLETNVNSVQNMMGVFRSIIPARLVPVLKYWFNLELNVHPTVSTHSRIQKKTTISYPYCGNIIGNDSQLRLGYDGSIIKLPQRLGTFHLSERRGSVSTWKLGGCRITSSTTVKSSSSLSFYRLPKLSEDYLQLNGAWAVGGRSPYVGSTVKIGSSSEFVVTSEIDMTINVVVGGQVFPGH
ncbi:hypothetical protein CCP3SC15_100038 [Gammaproteobacteria bacterium]